MFSQFPLIWLNSSSWENCTNEYTQNGIAAALVTFHIFLKVESLRSVYGIKKCEVLLDTKTSLLGK